MGINILTTIVGSYLTSALLTGGFGENVQYWTYENKDLVIAGVWAVLVTIAKALDGIIDLPFATLADKLNSKLGRRKTGLLIGVIPTIITYLLFMIPLNKGATLLNTIWFGGLLCIFYAFYTLTMLTYYATFSEVCANEKDTLFLSNVKSVCDVVYFILAFALLPVFVNMGLNVRIVALIFLPLSLTMLIPFFLLKENDNEEKQVRSLTLVAALKTSFQNKPFIYWMFTVAVMTIGLQLFLGGINELFSTLGLNQTVVMATAFVPVPFTLILYNHIVRKKGLAFAFRYILLIFILGMLVTFGCTKLQPTLTETQLTVIAIIGGLLVSFAIGAFFSVTYTVPSQLASNEFERSGKSVSAMLFAVQGLFEGIAAGVATGLILVSLKDNNAIRLLPIVVIIACVIAFLMSFGFHKEVAMMGKAKENKTL